MPDHSYLFSTSPTWVKTPHNLSSALPENVKSWIFERHSLTQRLRAHYGKDFAVRILNQRWYKPFIDESRLLGIPEHRFTLIREVLLHAQGQPLILARSIIPQHTIAVAKRNLSHLGTRPLGEVIFAYPNLQRLALEMSLIPSTCWQPHCKGAFTLPPLVYGRRTIYAIPTQPMLVSEIFMPEILDIPPRISSIGKI